MSEQLNPEQRKAVQTTEGPVLILAGAGSGKTKTLVHRVAHLLRKGVSAREILAVSFTNKAAQELRERVVGMVGRDAAKGITVCTFHSFCVRVLRREAERLGRRKTFVIYSAGDQLALMRRLLRENALSDSTAEAYATLTAISNAKNRLQTAQTYRPLKPGDPAERLAKEVFALYERALFNHNAMDFDDLLLLTVQLFAEHPEALEHWRGRYRYLMVDEYQDTNLAQYRIVRALAEEHRNLCVVGDDDQSIYGWRGAHLGNILQFEEHFPGATVIRLEQNYRSTEAVLQTANRLIAHNTGRKEKALWTELGQGRPVEFHRLDDDEDEAQFVADRIWEFKEAGGWWRECAVLYRANAQSRILEEIFRKRQIPYRVVGALQFYDRKEVKDLLAYIKLLVNPEDDVSLLRVINYPARGIGAGTLKKLNEAAMARRMTVAALLPEAGDDLVTPRARKSIESFSADLQTLREMQGQLKPSDLVRKLIGTFRLEDELRRNENTEDQARNRIENLHEVVSGIGRWEDERDEEHPEQLRLGAWLDEISLVSDKDDEEDENPNAVTLMTMHSAKGLEFKHVNIVGLEEGLIPHARSIQESNDNPEEERRLLYVGVTRARRRLYISAAAGRKIYGRTQARETSRFLKELRNPLLVEHDWSEDGNFDPEANMPDPEELARQLFARARGGK